MPQVLKKESLELEHKDLRWRSKDKNQVKWACPQKRAQLKP